MEKELKESQSTVNQLTVQIQELQDSVNSMNDARDFEDLETVSHPLVVPRFLGKPRRECGPQMNTRNLCSMPGNVFVDSHASNESAASRLQKCVCRKSNMDSGRSRMHRETCCTI